MATRAYSELADEMRKLKQGTSYTAKVKGAPKVKHHFATDYTGRGRLATRKLPKVVSGGSYEEVYELLRQGADPQEADSKGRTPLHFAACRGEVGVVQVLVSHGGSVNKQDDIGNTPLHLACAAGHIGAVTVLLKAGTDLMSTDRRGNTPLHLAFSRLRVLNKVHTSPPLIRKIEIENIIDMLKEYLSRHAEGRDDEEEEEEKERGIILKPKFTKMKNDIDELERLAGQLSLSDTQEKVDQVHGLLENFTELSIHKLETVTRSES